MSKKPYNHNRNFNWKNKPKTDNKSGEESNSNNGNKEANQSQSKSGNYYNRDSKKFDANKNTGNNNRRLSGENNKNSGGNNSENNSNYKKDGLPTENKNNLNRNRRPNKKRFNPRSNENFRRNKNYNNQQPPKPKEPIVYEICSICEKEIQQPLYAIKELETGKNAHFECIQKKILENEKLEPNEKLYYLGGGAFGIVRERRQRGRLRFTTLKRIQYGEKK